MKLSEFTTAIGNLCDYYERKVQTLPQTLELWHTKVKHIPAEALPWIVRRITEEYESYPRNVPMAIRSAADEWWQAHPEKRVEDKYHDCPDCDKGLLFLKRYDKDMQRDYEYVFRCERCQQSRVEEYPKALKVSLMAMGYFVPKHLEAARQTTYKPKSMDRMIEQDEEHRQRVKEQAQRILQGQDEVIPF